MRFSLSPLLSDAEVDEAAVRIGQCVREISCCDDAITS